MIAVKLWIHQCSVLRPLLCASVMDALTDNVVKTIKEFIYSDNLILVRDNRKEVEEKTLNGKRRLEARGEK